MKRDEQGKFVERKDSLGKTYGVRIRKDLDPVLQQIASASGMSATAWCRQVIEQAVLAAQE
ncbi:MAG: hypothetical protein AAFV85_27385 [Cyanobacteria bacterium J06634_6]